MSSSDDEWYECSDRRPIVLDCGSTTTRIGFAGNDAPTYIFPTVVGRPHGNYGISGSMLHWTSASVGERALSRRNHICLKLPLDRGTIVDEVAFEDVCRHAVGCLTLIDKGERKGVDPSAHHFVLVGPSPTVHRDYMQHEDRKRMIKIIFDVLDAPAVYTVNQATLSLLASDRCTGIVLHSSDSATHAVPVFEGYTLAYAVQSIELGGRDLTEHMMGLLNENGSYPFATAAEREVAAEIKETLCFVAANKSTELKTLAEVSRLEKTYYLRDGKPINVCVGSERVSCPEVLFNQSLADFSCAGIHELIVDSVKKWDPDLHSELYANIVLSGGNCMFPGIVERLTKEVAALAPPSMKVRGLPAQEHSAWIGGSKLGDLPTFQMECITREEYHSCGMYRWGDDFEAHRLIRHKCMR